MISFEQAIAILDAHVGPLELSSRPVTLGESLGCVAVGAYVSRVDLPPFDKSAMDGYAIRAEDDRLGELDVLEVVPAGQLPTMPLRPGAASKVMTGSAVPEGTAKVVMIEKTQELPGRVRIVQAEKRLNICRRGEDVQAGQVVLTGPRRISPCEVANLVSCGITEVQVSRAIRATILATGDEIVDDTRELSPGKIMNANGPMLAALCRANGLEVVRVQRVCDTPTATLAAIRQGMEDSDILILTGGVSAGDFDFVGASLVDAGLKVHYDAVSIKPGRPMTFATGNSRIPTDGASGRKVVLGLPGNPVSVYLMFHLFVLRAARRLAGLSAELRTVSCKLVGDYRRKHCDRTECVPCRVNSQGALEAVEFHGSAHLAALLDADGVFLVEQGRDMVSSGQDVPFIALRELYQ